MKIDVLGTEYEIKEMTEAEYPKLKGSSGLCEIYAREIIIRKDEGPDPNHYSNLEACIRATVRHEIIHAFFAESGLRANCDYASNEELVDWIAHQFPKLARAFKAAGCED